MSPPQIATMDAQIGNKGVEFVSTHDELRLDEDGAWIFTLLKNTPTEVVFHLRAIDEGGCQRVVRSRSRETPDDPFGDWVDWELQQGVYVSPAFVHEHDFRLEVVLCASPNPPPTGGGFFKVRDEGSGGD